MPELELQVLNGDQAGLQVSVAEGSYRILRRSADNFDLRSTLVSSNIEQWRLSQEDLEMAAANLGQARTAGGSAALGFDAFDRADDIAIWDQRMSQPHAIIMCESGVVTLVDMGSRNGTFVNGERVGAAELRDGDLLRFGTTRVTVHL